MHDKQKYVVNSIKKKSDGMIYVVAKNVKNQEKRLLRFKPEDSYQLMLDALAKL